MYTQLCVEQGSTASGLSHKFAISRSSPKIVTHCQHGWFQVDFEKVKCEELDPIYIL